MYTRFAACTLDSSCTSMKDVASSSDTAAPVVRCASSQIARSNAGRPATWASVMTCID